jgi:hypothetical protein
MIYASVFSVAVLLWLVLWFARKHTDDLPAIIGLFLKIAAGLALGLVYKFYYSGGDTFQYLGDARAFTNYLIDYPKQAVDVYFATGKLDALVSALTFSDQPRALLFVKLISGLYLLAGGDYWILATFLSVISFFCVFLIVKELLLWYPNARRPLVVSFYFLPSFVFWTSGVLKESLAVGALLVMITFVLKIVRTQRYAFFPYWLVIAMAAGFLWGLKYYYAAVAFPVLFSFLLHSIIFRKQNGQAYLVLVFFLFACLAAMQMHYNLKPSHIAGVVYQNYLTGLESAEPPTLHYYYFDGSPVSFALNTPLALIYGLFRPMIFEGTKVFQVIVGIENAIILILVLLGFGRYKKGIALSNPLLISASMYILLLTVMLAFSTPNLGTLSRYKVGCWPFFVMLVLMLHQANPISMQRRW